LGAKPLAGRVKLSTVTLVGEVRWTFLALALLATLVTVALLLWTLRSRASQTELPRSDRRKPSPGRPGDPREALALVGDALAATHNPRVLLPVVLEVITEATGSRGGQVFAGGEEVAWIGEVGGGLRQIPLSLGFAADGETRLVLFPPDEGFSAETERLAEWLAAQASVALDNARLHDVVQRQAITDDLTGLVNRRRFIEALDAEVERARSFGSPLTLVLADLDNFKNVNDAFGHHGGDAVLRAFADLIRSHVRDVDVSGRLGGEEFAILLPETGCEGAVQVAERMRASLNAVQLAVSDQDSITVASSFGVAELEANQSGDDLLRAADAALYRAKGEGKNRVATAQLAGA
jgi:diguanylate cyclase (GGDEF)-like protein